MRHAEPTRPEREREGPRPPAPSPVPAHLAALIGRGGISNRALARTLTVTAYRWQPKYPTADDDVVNFDVFKQELLRGSQTKQQKGTQAKTAGPAKSPKGKVTAGAKTAAPSKAVAKNPWPDLTAEEKVRLDELKGSSVALAAPDVASLTPLVIAHVAGSTNKLRSQQLTRDHSEWFANALGIATTFAAKNVAPFDAVTKFATVKSRSKGVPNQVPLNALTQVGAVKSYLLALRGQVAARNTELDQLNTYLNKPLEHSGGIAASGLSIRTAHENRATWLPVHNQAALVSNATVLTWTQGPNAGQAAAPIAGGNASARAVERGAFDAATKNSYYTNVWAAALPQKRDKVRHAWREYASDQLVGCPYIEFNGNPGGEVSRIVWDYVNDVFYICMHYDWVKGFNPFIRVNDLGPTI